LHVYPLECLPHFQGDFPTGQCFQLVENFHDESATGLKGDSNFGFAFVSVSLQLDGQLFYAYMQGIGVTGISYLKRTSSPSLPVNQTRSVSYPKLTASSPNVTASSPFITAARSIGHPALSNLHLQSQDHGVRATTTGKGPLPSGNFACRDGALIFADKCTDDCGVCEFGPATPLEWLMRGVPGIAELLAVYEQCAEGLRLACDGDKLTTYSFSNRLCLGSPVVGVMDNLCFDAGRTTTPGLPTFCFDDAAVNDCAAVYYDANCPGLLEGRYPTVTEIGQYCFDLIASAGLDMCIDQWYCPFFEYPGAQQEWGGTSFARQPYGKFAGEVAATSIGGAPMRLDLRAMTDSFYFEREVMFAGGCASGTRPCGRDAYDVVPASNTVVDFFNDDFRSICTPAVAGANPTGVCFHSYHFIPCGENPEALNEGCIQFVVLSEQTDGSYFYSNLYGQLPVFQAYLEFTPGASTGE
jgi:hypothetical protein